MFLRQLAGVDQNNAYRLPVALPHVPVAVRALALRITGSAAALLSLAPASLLSVSRQRDGEPQLVLWNAIHVPDPDLLRDRRGDEAISRQLGELEESAGSLIDHLAERWPPAHVPHALGFITDGTGIGLSPEDPCPSQPGWLLRQVTGETSLATLLPFAGATPWGAIQHISRDARHH